jgi:predicted TIM-barrel fold metal-dependent hydrolase
MKMSPTAVLPYAGTPVPFSSGTSVPAPALPELTCDCHMHVYGAHYAREVDAVLQPPDASLTDYLQLRARLGITRHVIVLPSTYGIDNTSLTDALKASGADASCGASPYVRGIAVADTSVTLTSLHELSLLGVVGLRFNLVRSGSQGLDDACKLAPLLADLGWHLEFHLSAQQLAAIEDYFTALPCEIVFDHMARIPFARGTEHAAFSVLNRLLVRGQTWVKLWGAYLAEQAEADDVLAFGRALVALAPERMVWGSDWPHPAARALPDDVAQLTLLTDWCNDVATRKAVLVDNPARLYRF